MPVYGTIAAKFNDDGVPGLYQALLKKVDKKAGVSWENQTPVIKRKVSSSKATAIPPERVNYLSEIAETVRRYHRWVDKQSQIARKAWQLKGTLRFLREDKFDEDRKEMIGWLEKKREEIISQMDSGCRKTLKE